MSERDVPQLYLKTVVLIEEDGSLVPASNARCVAQGVVHVLTGWNPGDERPSREENDATDEELRTELVSRGLNPCRAVGADPDSEHAEESWAVCGLSDDEARAIGAAFGQVAVFRLTATGQAVMACFEDWVVSRRW
jgi:hypothetical protein